MSKKMDKFEKLQWSLNTIKNIYNGMIEELQVETKENHPDKSEEEFMLMQELVDKATPKKTNVVSWGDRRCPICDERLEHYFVYCAHCGQLLDRSKE